MPGSDPAPAPAPAPDAVKILIAGGFGVGKTTMVGSVSEITPLRTEERLTAVGQDVDDLVGVENKHATTVALDFGRITLTDDVVLYLFGTPGQQRFWFMWNDLALGALGGVVLVDTRRLETSFAAIDFFERRGIPFVIGANGFDGRHPYTAEAIRDALAVPGRTQVVLCDARDRASSVNVLLALVDQLIATTTDTTDTTDTTADTADTTDTTDTTDTQHVAGAGSALRAVTPSSAPGT